MTFVVPFDGSELAAAALVRAVEYSTALEEPVTAVAVIPERKRYAREKGWIDEGESYDVDAVVDALRDQVASLAPKASFDYERIREFPPEARLAARIEQLVLKHDPGVVFLGSDNVGRVVTPLTSVGVHLADEEAYDVHIVRRASPPDIGSLDAHETFYRDRDSP